VTEAPRPERRYQPPGTRSKRPTMLDVATRVGVSRALVSLVFRNQPGASAQTREKVFQAAAELGYSPDSAARLLARNSSKALGVMLTVRNPFHADLIEEVYPTAEALGYDVVLSASAPTRDERRAVEALISHRCEALILFGPTEDAGYLAELAGRLPVVVVGRRLRAIGVDLVHTAEAKGTRQALEHVVGLGHRAIVHIDGGHGSGSIERRRAYHNAMHRYGLEQEKRVLRGDHTEASGVRAAEVLLAEDRLPTAVLASNDRCAMGLLDALQRAGMRVPDDISIVGFDDSHVARLSHIDLTTVRQDVPRIAEFAVRAAIDRLNDPELATQERILSPELVIRGTTAPPRASVVPQDLSLGLAQ
jgi:DNA-binding LacI/PurR family transcriptional regulator